MKAGGPLSALAALMCLAPHAADADCTIPQTRQLPCEGCGTSEPGGLYPGEVFHTYVHGDSRSEHCKVGGILPVGTFCQIDCQAGWGDADAGRPDRDLTCLAADPSHVERIDWEHLPKCEQCAEDSYKTDVSADTCDRCPGLLYTGKKGATSHAECNQCKPGTIGTPPGNCRLAPRTEGWGKCPDRCDPTTAPGKRCTWSWDNSSAPFPYEFSNFAGVDAPSTCSVVNIVGVESTIDDSGGSQWFDGLKLFQEHINKRGGLRLGQGAVGYVNITIVKVGAYAHDPQKYENEYKNLCYEDGEAGKHGSGWSAHVQTAPKLYLTPPNVEDEVTSLVLALSLGDCEGQTFLAGSEAKFPEPPLTPWPGVYSIYGQESGFVAPSENATNPVELLCEKYGARTFGISGVDVKDSSIQVNALKEAIKNCPGASLSAPVSLAPSSSRVVMKKALRTVAESNPDVFIGIGEPGAAFQNMLAFFADINAVHSDDSDVTGYSPYAAFYMGGLAVNPPVATNAYNYNIPETDRDHLEYDSDHLPCKNGKECWSFDQWMGFVPWTSDMPHAGPIAWPAGLENRYHMAADDDNDRVRGMRQRYLGSATDFNQRAFEWLKANKAEGGSPTFYHAKAAASLLLFQMAVEFAPKGDGYGLQYSELSRDNIRDAIVAMNNSQGVETFWGPIRIRPDEDEGWNRLYSIGIGQFKNNQTYPSLVHYDRLPNVGKAEYPAKWPDWCLVHGSTGILGVCPITYLRTTEIIVGSVVIGTLVLALTISCCVYWKRRSKRYAESIGGIRRSLLGSTELPDAQLTQRNVASRWATTRVFAQANVPDLRSLVSPSSKSSPGGMTSFQTASGGSMQAGGGSSNFGSGATRIHSGLTAQTQVPVMFTDAHVRELYPSDFKQIPKNRLGKGTYGTVYRAQWRGVEVAVKAIELPHQPRNERDTAVDAHRKKLQKITKDFVKEVGCELLHPNLVQMLGYATVPSLFIVQELLTGGSLDKQLYVEHWRPSRLQTLKGALDIASAVEHLHTHFERGAKGRDSKVKNPVIHRDLKSPNILLDRPPPMKPSDDWTVELKVSDFGLSRDKETTGTLDDKTGAMSGVGSVLWMAPEMLRGETYNESVDVYSYAMCLVELSHCTMPWQDTGARPHEVPVRVTSDERPESQLREASEEMQQLIRDCWHKFPANRPNIAEVVERVTEMHLNEQRDIAERLSQVEEAAAEREASGEYGASRPASPGRLQTLSDDASGNSGNGTSY